jgi:hypothetical protein
MNPKMAYLLSEGISIKTLEKMNNYQINLVYERVKKSKEVGEQAKPVEKTVTSKVIELPSGAETVVGGQKVKNDAGKTVITTTPQEGEMTEKSLSKKQQQFFGIVRGMQKGDIPKKGKAGKAAKEMDPEDVVDFASTEHKGLPKRKNKKETKEDSVKKIEESIMKLIESHLYPTITKSDLLGKIKKYKR